MTDNATQTPLKTMGEPRYSGNVHQTKDKNEVADYPIGQQRIVQIPSSTFNKILNTTMSIYFTFGCNYVKRQCNKKHCLPIISTCLNNMYSYIYMHLKSSNMEFINEKYN